jgi:hypothetical protein
MMAFAKPLSQVQRDLSKYASQKTYQAVLDVIQSFEIAGETKEEGAACVGAAMIRVAAALAVGPKVPMRKENFMRFCAQCYDAAFETMIADKEGST